MKKIIAMLLALVMVLAFAACAPADGGETTKAPEGGEATQGGSDLKVSVFWYDESDAYLSTVRSALNAELDKLGVTYDNQYAGNNQSTQTDQIRTAVTGGSNLLVVNVVTSGSPDVAEEILKIAGDIPVVFFNRAIGTEGKDVPVLEAHSNACFIGTDAPEAGHLQGQMIGEYLVENYDEVDVNGDGVISYALFKGDESNIEAIYRTQYAVEDANKVLAEAGKEPLKYFDPNNADGYQVDLNGQWSATAAKDYMDTNFITYNEASGNMIELVICNNDGMAQGAIASLQAQNYNLPGQHVVPVFGVDAIDAAIQLIADGAMTGTVKQDAEGMAAAIAGTVASLKDGKTPVEALAAQKDDRFSVAADCTSKLYVAYAPYTGE